MREWIAKNRVAAAVGAAALVALVAWSLTTALTDGTDGGTPAAGTASGDDPAALGGTGSDGADAGAGDDGGTPGDKADGRPGNEKDGDDAGVGDGSGDADNQAPTGEHQPVGGTDTPAEPQPGEEGFRLPGLKNPPAGPPEFLVEEAPSPAFAQGQVAAGYPVEHFPLLKRARVVSSEVTSEGTRVQAVLQGTCPCSVDRVVGFHDQAAARLGMDASSAPAVGGSTARAYQDGSNSGTLTVARDGNLTRFSLVLLLTAERA